MKSNPNPAPVENNALLYRPPLTELFQLSIALKDSPNSSEMLAQASKIGFVTVIKGFPECAVVVDRANTSFQHDKRLPTCLITLHF